MAICLLEITGVEPLRLRLRAGDAETARVAGMAGFVRKTDSLSLEGVPPRRQGPSLEAPAPRASTSGGSL